MRVIQGIKAIKPLKTKTYKTNHRQNETKDSIKHATFNSQTTFKLNKLFRYTEMKVKMISKSAMNLILGFVGAKVCLGIDLRRQHWSLDVSK
jgi:hypothetical protein